MPPGGEDGPGSGSHSRFFSGLIVIGILLTSGALSDQVLIYTVVELRLLATNYNCIAAGLSLSLNLCFKIDSKSKSLCTCGNQTVVGEYTHNRDLKICLAHSK